MQLNKFIAASGLASRRHAVELIQKGKIFVNGLVQRIPAYRVQPEDRVEFQGRRLQPEAPIYLVLNKPRGYVTTCSDEKGRATVLDLCGNAFKGKRVFPIGRLDRDSRGLLLLTNDGEFAQQLAHPRYGAQKHYRVMINKPLEEDFAAQLCKGIRLADGYTKFDKLVVGHNGRVLDIWLHSGKNRIIRRMLQAGSYDVLDLERVGFAGLSARDLPAGGFRRLTKSELARLKKEEVCCDHN